MDWKAGRGISDPSREQVALREEPGEAPSPLSESLNIGEGVRRKFDEGIFVEGDTLNN